MDLLEQLLNVLFLFASVVFCLGFFDMRNQPLQLLLDASGATIFICESSHRYGVFEIVGVVVEIRSQHGAVVVNMLQRLELVEAERV